MQQCINIYYSMFIRSSTCFGRHTAHHQELKTALAASGFAYVKGCWTLWLLDSNHNVQQPFTYAKPEAATAVDSNHNVQQPFTYAKPEAASAVLSS